MQPATGGLKMVKQCNIELFFGFMPTAQCCKIEKRLQKINIRLFTDSTKPCKGLTGT